MLIGAFQAGVGLWQFGPRGSGPDHFAILNDRFYRAFGTFEQPNPYGGYLGLVFPLGAGLVANWALERLRVSNLSRLLAVLFTTTLMGAALVASWSRGAWIGMGAAALAMLVALPRRAWAAPAASCRSR